MISPTRFTHFTCFINCSTSTGVSFGLAAMMLVEETELTLFKNERTDELEQELLLQVRAFRPAIHKYFGLSLIQTSVLTARPKMVSVQHFNTIFGADRTLKKKLSENVLSSKKVNGSNVFAKHMQSKRAKQP